MRCMCLSRGYTAGPAPVFEKISVFTVRSARSVYRPVLRYRNLQLLIDQE
jgi:hypothetical protein